MKRFVGMMGLLLFACAVGVQAQAKSETRTAEQLAKTFSKAYAGKRLASLDRERLFAGTIKFVIKHSLAEDNAPDKYEVRTFKTLAQAERWLKKRGVDENTPSRETKPLKGCRKGVCTFDVLGLLHNQLFLTKITYGSRKGRLYIKTVYLTDGD
jgi:hypothetical protein